MEIESPSIKRHAYTCAFCGAYSRQDWHWGCANYLIGNNLPEPATGPGQDRLELFQNSGSRSFTAPNLFFAKCHNCSNVHLWLGDKLVFPRSSVAPPANLDTPAAILQDYNEARDVLALSPRASAALLRLAIQKLCIELGGDGKNINNDIAALVKKGLDVRVQKALDILRVVGNESVHPGSMDLNDDPETAESLFRIFNVIVEKMISEPKHVDDIYSKLPPDKRKAIEERDK